MFAENREILTEFGRFDPELARLALKIDQVNVALCRRPEFQIQQSHSFLEIAARLFGKYTSWKAYSEGINLFVQESKPRSIKGMIRITQTELGGKLLDVETLLDVDGEEITRRRLSELSIREGNLEYLPTPKQLMGFEVRIYNLVN